MSDRVCIFVDGENFRHSIGDLFSNFERSDYLPKSAEWTSLFDWIVQQVTADGIRVRTYWYVVDSVDFYPYRIPDTKTHAERLLRLLSGQESYKRKLDSLEDNARLAEMEKIVGQLEDRQSAMVSRANGWRAMQNGIAGRHKAVEFRRAGAITFNLFEDGSREKRQLTLNWQPTSSC